MRNLTENNFEKILDFIVNEGSSSFILEALCNRSPSGYAALKVCNMYDRLIEEGIKEEINTLEKLFDTSYVPYPIGSGETNSGIRVKDYHNMHRSIDSPRFNKISIEGVNYVEIHPKTPFIVTEWIEGNKIFHPSKPKDEPQPFKRDGRNIIRQYADFLDKSARKGIYLSDLKDVLYCNGKIKFTDVGMKLDPSDEGGFNWMTANFLKNVLTQVGHDMEGIPNQHGNCSPSKLYTGEDRYPRISLFSETIPKVNEHFRQFAKDFNSGRYGNNLDLIEGKLLGLLEDMGYKFLEGIRYNGNSSVCKEIVSRFNETGKDILTVVDLISIFGITKDYTSEYSDNKIPWEAKSCKAKSCKIIDDMVRTLYDKKVPVYDPELEINRDEGWHRKDVAEYLESHIEKIL